MNDIGRARAILKENAALTCAFVRGEEMLTSAERGVKPLVALAEEGKRLQGFSCADRVVGRAAALLYVLLGAKEVHAEVLSRAGEEVFKAHKTAYGCDIFTERIVNRAGTGLCPMELATEGISDPAEGFHAIRNKLKELAGVGRLLSLKGKVPE